MKITSLAYSRPEDDPKHRKNPDAVRPAPSPLGLAALGVGGGGSSGTSITINSTDTFMPYRSAAATFADSPIVRAAASQVRISNTSTGGGQLLLGTSTDTYDAQLSVYSQSTTRPGLKLRALSGTAATQASFENYDAAGTLNTRILADGTIYIGTSSNQRITNPAANQLALWAAGAIQLQVESYVLRLPQWSNGTPILFGNDSNENGVSNRAGSPIRIQPKGGSGTGSTAYVQLYTGLGAASGTTGHTSELAIQTILPATGTPGIAFGGTTSSFPALKRSSTSISVRLADDSDDAPLTTLTVKTKALTVATLPAAATAGAGARAFVTDANATTFLSTVAAGGANAVPVVSDGTNWLIG